MRTCAKVGEFALLIEGNLLALGKLFNKLNLIRLILFGHKLDSLVAGKGETLDKEIFLNDLLHFRLDVCEYFRGEGDVAVDIIVKARFDCGADGQLCCGMEALYRLRENVRRSVPENVLAVCICEGENFYVRIFTNLVGQRYYTTVNACRERRAVGEILCLCRLVDGDGSVKLDSVDAFKFDFEHFKYHSFRVARGYKNTPRHNNKIIPSG